MIEPKPPALAEQLRAKAKAAQLGNDQTTDDYLKATADELYMEELSYTEGQAIVAKISARLAALRDQSDI
jgi:hypothetical protein